jgi:hypothetical protein
MTPIEIELDGKQIGVTAETYTVIELPDLDLKIEYHGDHYGRRATVYYKDELLSECTVSDNPVSLSFNKRSIPSIEKGELPTVVSNNLILRKIFKFPS